MSLNEKLKEKYEKLLIDIEERIVETNNEFEFTCAEAKLLGSLNQNVKYFREKYLLAHKSQKELQQTIIDLKEEKESIQRIINVINEQIKNSSN